MKPGALERQLENEEGRRFLPYRDSKGIWTVGVGHNMSVPFSDRVVNFIRDEDIAIVIAGLNKTLPWWTRLDDVRQQVLADLAFNLGMPRLLGFKKTLAFLQTGFYSQAADELLDSDAARDLPRRYNVLAAMIRTGVDPYDTAASGKGHS